MYVENDPSSDLSELSDDFSERDEDSDEEYGAVCEHSATRLRIDLVHSCCLAYVLDCQRARVER